MRKSEKFFFLFVAIILIPSIIFAYKAYRMIANNTETLLLKERLQIDSVLSQISEKTEEELLAREYREGKRPYYEYSYYYNPEGTDSIDDLRKSPISEFPEDKLILGYFQIDDDKNLTTPFLLNDEHAEEIISDYEYKKKFLQLVNSKAYPTLLKEMLLSSKPGVNPFKPREQSHLVQLKYENVKEIFNMINSKPSDAFDFTKKLEHRTANKKLAKKPIKSMFEVVKYYPIRYLYQSGSVFAFRRVEASKKTLIQGYMINIVYLVDNILRKFIAANTPDNFSIFASPVEGKELFASASISNKLDFIKLYVYKNDNSHIDSIIRDETRKYIVSTLSLFVLLLVGCGFIFRMIRSEAYINQKKSDFISAVTHELKTPLTSIRLYSEMLKDDMIKDDAKKKVYYNYMLKESERLTRLINNVLDFSKIENNKKVFNISAGDLRTHLLELCEKYESNLKLSGFKFTYDICDVGSVRFDRDAITQVFINIVENAVKYSAKSDTKEIDVKLFNDNGKVALEIKDKGIGIAKNQQKAIFEKFYRIENELTRTSTGSGIGLSIVKEYVKAHKGTLEVVSRENEGAKFRILLPKSV